MIEKILLQILPIIISAISPSLRQIIENLVKQLEIESKKTDNKFDDLLVVVLKAIFQV